LSPICTTVEEVDCGVRVNGRVGGEGERDGERERGMGERRKMEEGKREEGGIQILMLVQMIAQLLILWRCHASWKWSIPIFIAEYRYKKRI
jgi:hypothetical protein